MQKTRSFSRKEKSMFFYNFSKVFQILFLTRVVLSYNSRQLIVQYFMFDKSGLWRCKICNCYLGSHNSYNYILLYWYSALHSIQSQLSLTVWPTQIKGWLKKIFARYERFMTGVEVTSNYADWSLLPPRINSLGLGGISKYEEGGRSSYILFV